MNAARLLDELQTIGVKVWPDAGQLRFKAPAGVMTPDLTERLKAAKPELLAILAGQPAANDDTPPEQDLPLLAALAEFDGLIERLCDARAWPDAVRTEMREARRRMSPDNVRKELPYMRQQVRNGNI